VGKYLTDSRPQGLGEQAMVASLSAMAVPTPVTLCCCVTL
jgi:hypothetical protein